MSTTVTYNLVLLGAEGLPTPRVQIGLYAPGMDPISNRGLDPLIAPFWVTLDPTQGEAGMVTAVHATAEAQLAIYDASVVQAAQNAALRQMMAKYVNVVVQHPHTTG